MKKKAKKNFKIANQVFSIEIKKEKVKTVPKVKKIKPKLTRIREVI